MGIPDVRLTCFRGLKLARGDGTRVHPAVSCSGRNPSPVARTYPRTGKSAGDPRPYRT